ncbi:glycosyltransferase [Helcobacillus massiliensis]|uniref:glycosyltransferase n=1 Tax=Helcobacillus massiliensis TaxID=521392 RepID=UPI0021A5AE23|nr:glycosyltransferase [Helcobacillus massiliensis]MCT2035905.1 glycosyltransferase [Helcobacillus massiliensis]MCT2331825.1 glycosyltransferase [Helcobacillus massiliensis]
MPVRSYLRISVLAAAFGGLVLLGLLIWTAIDRSTLAVIVTAAVGAGLILIGAVLALGLERRITHSRNLVRTRVSHLERARDTTPAHRTQSPFEQPADAADPADQRRPNDAAEEPENERRNDAGNRAVRLAVENGIAQGRDVSAMVSADEARVFITQYLAEGAPLRTGPLIRAFGVPAELSLSQLRTLYKSFRGAGYTHLAVQVLTRVTAVSGKASDKQQLEKIRAEQTVMQITDLPRVPVHRPSPYSARGPILHLVGRVLPDTQTGYTLRTHYTVQAQRRMGLTAAVVAQPGISTTPVRETTRYLHDGVPYYLLPGRPRSAQSADRWLQRSVTEFARLVQRLRPSILHAHSDFYNALIVHAVGKAYGIPTVYESRGFWEESWLDRMVHRQPWADHADEVFSSLGLPDEYIERRRAEITVRSLVDRNLTLSETMRRHIVASSDDQLSADHVHVVPNAVQPDEFDTRKRNGDLARRLGIPDDAITVGYISSLVGYEGIDVLIDGFHRAQQQNSPRVRGPLYLLIVGDGSERETLEQQVRDAGVQNVVFTGRVPHEEILDYYSIIDLFVVPRRSAAVTDLVTPLKPFEAFCTGRAVIMSDVKALREIAEASGAARTFRAGDPGDLGRQIISLAGNTRERKLLGARAALWVRTNRTWDQNARVYRSVYRELGHRSELKDRILKAVSPRSEDFLQRRAGTAARIPKRADGPRFRVVVVAMKPQIAGRIRRNILTFLEMGAEVIVVNSRPRVDFFQGIEHPNLSADFVDVHSAAQAYQARISRKNAERRVRWARERAERAEAALVPKPIYPTWMRLPLPGMQRLRDRWVSEGAVAERKRRRQQWQEQRRAQIRWWRERRRDRQQLIRRELNRGHRVNRFFAFWAAAPDRIEYHQPDLVVSSDLPGLVGASIAAKRLGVPHLHDCHELYLESTALGPGERRVLWPIEKRFMRRADEVVVVNQTIRDEYEARYGVGGRVLRNCAPAVPADVLAQPQDLRALAGIGPDTVVVLYQGGLMAGRGLDVCVRAAAHLPEQVHLVFIGKGRMLEELQQLAADVGAADRVHFLPAVQPADLPAFTAGADLGLIPYQPVSRNNMYALPNKVFEYTGAGIPIVSSDLPELHRIVVGSQCGAVYDPFDPKALADAIMSVIADDETYRVMRENSRAFGQANTWENERIILTGAVEQLLRLTDEPQR